MKVSEIMNPNPITCSSRDNLASAAMEMWNHDCGVLPVIDDGRIRGVITDRDICMALLFKGAKPAAITVGDVFSGKLYACSPNDDVDRALETMGSNQVRRLPVVENGRLRGVLSMNDIVRASRASEGPEHLPTYEHVVHAMQSICTHRPVTAAA